MAKLFIILAIVVCARFLYNKKQEYNNRRKLAIYKHNREKQYRKDFDSIFETDITNTTYEPSIVMKMNHFEKLTLTFGITITIMLGIFTCCLAVIVII